MHERRRTRRFQVGWPMKIRGIQGGNIPFEEAGVLKNISSGGAFSLIKNLLPVGLKVEFLVRIPFPREVWMKYSAQIARAEVIDSIAGIGVTFDSFRPDFVIG